MFNLTRTLKLRKDVKINPIMGYPDIKDIRETVKRCLVDTSLGKLRYSEVEHIYLQLISDILKANGFNITIWYTPGKDVTTKEFEFAEPKRINDFVDILLSFKYYNEKTGSYLEHTMFSITEHQKNKYTQAIKEQNLIGKTNIILDGTQISPQELIRIFDIWRNR